MTFSKSTALELCQLNLAAYSFANTGHCQLPDGFTGPVAIRMPAENRPLLLRRDPLDIWGYTTTRAGQSYIVFRGTQITSGIDFAQEWAEDALSLPLALFGNGHVHLGFYSAYQCLRGAIPNMPAPRIITGHSLGAALATLCWADLGGDLMTFASPRVGDPDFAKRLWDGGTVRVFNVPDAVPAVPTDPPFRHGGTPAQLNGPGGPLDLTLAHSLNSYATALEAL
jgi:hypothetical protein